MNYENPVPVAVALIPLLCSDGKPAFLGVVRANEPGRGGLALPGGYVDKGERAETATSREVLEETGLIIDEAHWQLLGTHITPANRLLVFSVSKLAFPESVLPSLAVNSEVSGFCRLTTDNLSQVVFPLHALVLKELLGS